MVTQEVLERRKYIKRLNLMHNICEVNFDSSMRKVVEAEKILDRYREELEKCRISKVKVEIQIREFHGQKHGNVKNY